MGIHVYNKVPKMFDTSQLTEGGTHQSTGERSPFGEVRKNLQSFQQLCPSHLKALPIVCD